MVASNNSISQEIPLQRLNGESTPQPQEMTRKNRWYHEVSTSDIVIAALAIIGLLGSGLLIGGGFTSSTPVILTGAGLLIVGPALILLLPD